MSQVKDHEISCEECKEFMIDEQMDKSLQSFLENKFRAILKEEWQTKIEFDKRIVRLEKKIIWLIAANIIELGALLSLIINQIK